MDGCGGIEGAEVVSDGDRVEQYLDGWSFFLSAIQDGISLVGPMPLPRDLCRDAVGFECNIRIRDKLFRVGDLHRVEEETGLERIG